MVKRKTTTLKDLWDDYQRRVMPANAPPVQLQECRRAFYAGLGSMFALVSEVADEVPNNEAGFNAGSDMLTKIVAELARHTADVLNGRA